MKLSMLLMLFVSIMISGCAQPAVITRDVKVNIPVPCEIVDPRCPKLNGLDESGVVIELGRCIDQYKENVKACQEK